MELLTEMEMTKPLSNLCGLHQQVEREQYVLGMYTAMIYSILHTSMTLYDNFFFLVLQVCSGANTNDVLG